MINEISENKLMDSFYNMIPYFKYIVKEEDLAFTITNTEKYLLVECGKKLTMNFKAGDKIPKGCAADVCMRSGKPMNVVVPKEVTGVISTTTVAIPVLAEGNIEGAIVIAMGIEKKDKMANLAKTLSEALTQVSSNVVDMAETFQQINETNSSIQNYIEETNENSKKTDEVLTFIDGIAKQTNLLGLNAAIESARAGEYGKGFGVVSTEIRKLSQSTKESITQINEILNNIQNSINEIYRRFESSNNLLENQTAGLQEITATIEELTSNAAILNEYTQKM